MTKEKLKGPKNWLDPALCEDIYNSYNRINSKSKISEPLPAFNTRYKNKLESVLGTVNLRGSILKYDVVQIASAYLVHFAKGQCFLNGNKRMAVIFTNLFLRINGYQLNISYRNLWKITIIVAEDKSLSTDDMKEMLAKIFYKNVTSSPQ